MAASDFGVNMILTFVTPEKKVVVNQPVDEVFVPAFKGELNILPGHAPMVTTLTTGIMKWRIAGSTQINQAVVSWGYCEVAPDGVRVLADLADLPEEVNIQEGAERLKTVDKRLQTETLSDEEWENLTREVARIQSQMDMVQKSH